MIKKAHALATLDTHIWIWLVTNDPRIRSSRFVKKIQEFESQQGLRVSVISVWEVGMLHVQGRIILPFSAQQWVQKALGTTGILAADLTPEIALESTQLAGDFHGDPADRMILATAKNLGATLVTADERMIQYAKDHHLETLSP
jgi:PIN domain nuclease of toxin-antitoxin system